MIRSSCSASVVALAAALVVLPSLVAGIVLPSLVAGIVLPSLARAQDAATAPAHADAAQVTEGEAAAQTADDDHASDATATAETSNGDIPPAPPETAEEAPPPPPPPPPESNPLSFHVPLIGEMTFAMTSTTVLRYVGDNYDTDSAFHFNDFFFAAYERLDLSLTSEKLRIDARLDSFVPVFADDQFLRTMGIPNHPYFTNPNPFSRQCASGFEEQCSIFTDALRLERLTANYTDGDLTMEFGDVYAVLARGIALTFRKTDLLGIDNAIRGGRIALNGQHFNFQAVAGLVNPQNIDPKTYALIRDPNDAVVGGEVVGRVGDNDDLELGAAASNVTFQDALDFQDTSGGTHRSVGVAGWHIAAPALLDGKLALYAEVDALRNQNVDTSGHPTQSFGRAVYASAQLQLTELTILAEWVDYNNYLIAPNFDSAHPFRVYSAVPTLELDGFLDVRDLFNRRGGSVKVDYAFLPGPWSISANALVIGLPTLNLDNPAGDPWQGALATHGWVGLHKHSENDWSLDIVTGYRRETQLSDDPSSAHLWHTGDFAQETIHGKIDASVAFGEHTLELGLDQRWDRYFDRLNIDLDPMTCHTAPATGCVSQDLVSRGGAAITYAFGITLTVTASLRWDNFKQQVVAERALHEWYPSIEVKWLFSPGNFVSAFFGTTPGGRLCSGGVCRDVPLFEGGMLQLVLRL